MAQEFLVSSDISKSSKIVGEPRMHGQKFILWINLSHVSVLFCVFCPFLLVKYWLFDVVELCWSIDTVDQAKFHHWHLDSREYYSL